MARAIGRCFKATAIPVDLIRGNYMKIKILDPVLAIICVAIAASFIIKARTNSAGQQSGEVKVNIVQLVNPADGTFPLQLEIIPETTGTSNPASSAGSRPASVQFKVTNKSTKRIDAYGVEMRTTAVIKGEEQTSKVYIARDWNIHPTSQYLGKLPPFESGGEVTDGPYNLNPDNNVTAIKEVTFKVDFILFDDGSSLKASENSGESILGKRQGAKKLREWAITYFKNNNVLIDMLYEQLKDRKIPSDISFADENEKVGAKLYCSYLLAIYNKDKMALEKHLMEEK